MSQNDTQNELYVDGDTDPVEVLEFVAERTAKPAVMRDGDVVVYNYHNRPLDAHALSEWAQDADAGVYLQPFQIPGVWAFMQRTLPKGLRDGDLLAYRQGEDRYIDYTNWRRDYVDPNVTMDGGREVSDLIDQIRFEVVEVMGDGGV